MLNFFSRMKRHSKKILSFALLVLAPHLFQGERCFALSETDYLGLSNWHDWTAEPLQQTSSLNGFSITAIHAQDGKHLFLATVDSVFFFDGHSLNEVIVEWEDSQGVPETRAVGFFNGSQHEVFLVSRSHGIFRFDYSSYVFRSLKLSASEPDTSKDLLRISDASRISDNSAIYLANGRLYHHNLRTNEILPVSARTTKFRRLTKSDGGSVYALSNDGKIVRFLQESVDVFEESFDACNVVAPITDGTLLSSHSRGQILFYSPSESVQVLSPSCETRRLQYAPNFNELGLSVSSIEHLPISDVTAFLTDRGLYLLSGKDIIHLHRGNSGLTSNELVSIVEVDEDAFLVGSFAGLHLVKRTRGIEVHSLPSANQPEIIDIAAGNGTTYFLSSPSNVYLAERIESSLRINLSLSLKSDDSITAIGFLGEHLYVGHRSGEVSILVRNQQDQAEEWRLLERVEVSATSITAISPINADLVLFSTLGEGLKLFTNRLVESVEIAGRADSRAYDRIIDLEITTEGDIRFVTFWGLHQASGGVAALKSPPAEPVTLSVDAEIADTWLHAEIGAVLFAASPDGHIYKVLNPSNGADRKEVANLLTPVFALEPIGSRAVLAVTSKGLYRIFSDGRVELFSKFGNKMAIFPDYGVSISLQQSGEVVFGGIRGFVSLTLDDFNRSKSAPSIFVARIQVSNSSSPIGMLERLSSVELRAYESFFSVVMQVKGFPQSDRVLFSHQLEGYEKTWISSGNQNKVTYTSLPPGEYVFRARGADSSGTWSTNEISFPVTVLPPWYQTWPAYCAYALAAGLMLVLLKRANETHTLREAAAELEQEIRLAHERELDDLQDHVDSTEVLAHQANTDSNQLIEAFEALIDAVDRASGEGGASSASRIDCLTERIENLKLLRSLQSTDALAAGVNLSEYADVLLEQLVAERGDHYSDIIFVNDIDGQPIPFGRAVSIGCILRELIVNALDHGHAAPVSGSIISIRLPAPVFDDNGRLSFTIVVEDNGKGDAAGFSALNGLGLRLVGAITERLHGSFTIEDIGGARATVIVTFDEIRH
jgi:two-component sensor histidine kinase